MNTHYSLLTTHYSPHCSLLTAHYSLLTTHNSQWPSTADAHPAIRALQRLLAELLTASEPEVVEAEAAEARAEAVGEEAVGAAAALGGARTATTFEVMIIYFQLPLQLAGDDEY